MINAFIVSSIIITFFRPYFTTGAEEGQAIRKEKLMDQKDVEEKVEAIFKILGGMPLSDAEHILHECTGKLHEHCVISRG